MYNTLWYYEYRMSVNRRKCFCLPWQRKWIRNSLLHMIVTEKILIYYNQCPHTLPERMARAAAVSVYTHLDMNGVFLCCKSHWDCALGCGKGFRFVHNFSMVCRCLCVYIRARLHSLIYFKKSLVVIKNNNCSNRKCFQNCLPPNPLEVWNNILCVAPDECWERKHFTIKLFK